MFPAIKPFHMQPHAEMRQPDILKVSPWQPCFENWCTAGGHLERVCLLWSCIITADTYHKPGRHLSLIAEKMLWPVRRCSAASEFFLRWRIFSFWTLKFTWTDFIQKCSFLLCVFQTGQASLMSFYMQWFDVLQRRFLLYCIFIYCWCYYISIT